MAKARLRSPFDIPLEELATLTLGEQEELLKRAYELSKQAIMRAFSENPDVVEVVVCDGQVIYMARELGEIDMELLEELMSQYGKPCYVFGRPEMVEEAAWASIDGDWYPTVELLIGSPAWDDRALSELGRRVVADFDTGCPTYFFDERVAEGIAPPPQAREMRMSLHLGRPFFYFPRRVRMGIRDVEEAFRSALAYAAFVRRWPESPLTLINPRREGLVGRKLMFDLALELMLNPVRRTTLMRLL